MNKVIRKVVDVVQISGLLFLVLTLIIVAIMIFVGDYSATQTEVMALNAIGSLLAALVIVIQIGKQTEELNILRRKNEPHIEIYDRVWANAPILFEEKDPTGSYAIDMSEKIVYEKPKIKGSFNSFTLDKEKAKKILNQKNKDWYVGKIIVEHIKIVNPSDSLVIIDALYPKSLFKKWIKGDMDICKYSCSFERKSNVSIKPKEEFSGRLEITLPKSIPLRKLKELNPLKLEFVVRGGENKTLERLHVEPYFFITTKDPFKKEYELLPPDSLKSKIKIGLNSLNQDD